MGAHPDDLEIGMGGTIRSLVERGHPVFLLDLTDGEPTPHGDPQTRRKEAAKSAELLGCDRKILEFPNRYLEDSIQNRKIIAAEIRAIRPDYLFAPYPLDAHPDHIAAGELAQAARFYAKLTKSDIPGEPCYPRRLIYYFPVHIRLRIEPSFVVDIGAHLKRKEAAIRCYESQFLRAGKESYIELIINENLYWGFQSGSRAAEPFFQYEIPAFDRWPEGYV